MDSPCSLKTKSTLNKHAQQNYRHSELELSVSDLEAELFKCPYLCGIHLVFIELCQRMAPLQLFEELKALHSLMTI